MVGSTSQLVVTKFVENTKNVRWREDGKKIVFEVSGQEFDPSVGVKALERYYNGKAYRRACVAAKNAEYDFESLKPHIVPHKDNPQFLFCWLTRSVLPLNCDVVKNHVNSRRFKQLRKKEEHRVAKRIEMLENRRKKKEARLLAQEQFMSVNEEVIVDEDIDKDEENNFAGDSDADEDVTSKTMQTTEVGKDSQTRRDTKKRKGRHGRKEAVRPRKQPKQPGTVIEAEPTDSLSNLRAKMRKKAARKRDETRSAQNRTRSDNSYEGYV